MFAEGAADFGEGLLLGIVEAETIAIAGIESGEGRFESGGEKSQIAGAMWIGRGLIDGDDRGEGVVVFEFGEAAGKTDGVDMALGEDGAEPGLEGAAAVEVAEEGAGGGFCGAGCTVGAWIFSSGQAIEVGEERVGEIAGGRGNGRAAEYSGSGGAEIGAVVSNEVIPGFGAVFGAGAGEGQVLEMQGGEIILDVASGRRGGGEMFRGTAFQGGLETIEGKTPGCGGGVGIETIDECTVRGEERGGGEAGGLCIFGVLFHTGGSPDWAAKSTAPKLERLAS